MTLNILCDSDNHFTMTSAPKCRISNSISSIYTRLHLYFRIRSLTNGRAKVELIANVNLAWEIRQEKATASLISTGKGKWDGLDTGLPMEGQLLQT